MCTDRVRPEHPERLVHLDAVCVSGRRFFFLMPCMGFHGDAVLHLLHPSEHPAYIEKTLFWEKTQKPFEWCLVLGSRDLPRGLLS